MKKLQCEVCGSVELKKNSDDVFECQHCGMQYSKDEVQKLLVDITGSVKVDRNDEVVKLMRNGKRFYESRDYDKAYNTFCDVLNIDPDNCEAIMFIGSTYSVKAVINGETNSGMSDEALVYYTDALQTKYKQIGECDDFYDFADELLFNHVYKHFYLAKKVLLQSRIHSIQRQQQINNIGASKFEMLINKVGASSEVKNAQSAYDDYFSDVIFRFENAVHELNLRYDHAKPEFIGHFVALMKEKYSNSLQYKNHSEWVKLDLEIIESFGNKYDMPQVSQNIKEFKRLLENSGIDPVKAAVLKNNKRLSFIGGMGVLLCMLGLSALVTGIAFIFAPVGESTIILTIMTGVGLLIGGIAMCKKGYGNPNHDTKSNNTIQKE